MNNNKLKILTNGIIKENPILVLILGTCPFLAVTTQASNAIGMGAAVTFVLLCSNVMISLLRKVISDKVRIPCYIVVIASFVTLVQMIVKAYLPALDVALGLYLPLIVVNCIILGRAEMFANKNNAFDSALDAIGMGRGLHPWPCWPWPPSGRSSARAPGSACPSPCWRRTTSPS